MHDLYKLKKQKQEFIVIYSFLGNSPASPAYEDGTDSEFRNVGN